jgi:hypothetical protein
MTGAIAPAFPIQNFVPIAYPGPLNAVSASILSRAATAVSAANGATQLVQAPLQSLCVNTVYNWGVAPFINPSAQAVNAASLNLALNNGGASAVINKIEMVYINNNNNGSPVTVYFPDTGMFVTCAASAAGYFPVFTNILACYVYNGFGGTEGGIVPSPTFSDLTQIIFCNFAIPAFQTPPEYTTEAGVGNRYNITGTGLVDNYPVLSGLVSAAEMTYITGSAEAAGPGLISCYIRQQAVGQPLWRATAGFVAQAAGAFVFTANSFRMNLAAAPMEMFAVFGPLELVCDEYVNLTACNFNFNLAYSQTE